MARYRTTDTAAGQGLFLEVNFLRGSGNQKE